MFVSGFEKLVTPDKSGYGFQREDHKPFFYTIQAQLENVRRQNPIQNLTNWNTG